MPWADMCFKYIKLLSSLILSNPNILSRFVHQWNEITRSKIKEVIFSKHRKCPQKIMVIQNNIFHTLLRFPSPIKLYISQFIRYSRKCGSCLDFLDRCLLLTRKLLNDGSHDVESFTVAIMTWYEMFVSQIMTMDIYVYLVRVKVLTWFVQW
jgi:hypothetical protein